MVVTVEGPTKWWALQQVFANGDVPASRLINVNLVWLVDEEAMKGNQ